MKYEVPQDSNESSTLWSYIKDQQDKATYLSELLDGADFLNHHQEPPGSIGVIIKIARDMAADLHASLDSAALPGE